MTCVFTVILLLANPEPPGDGGLHQPFDRLLRAHVQEGVVDYQAFKSAEGDLDRYLAALAACDPLRLSEKERLALWINAYNAFTIKLILERYPRIRSIKDIPRRWDLEKWVVGGRTWSLGRIEHEVLRKEFREPRIHFAIVCAARSCPDLRSEAYRADKLEEQLADAGRRFLASEQKGFKALREPGLVFGMNSNVYLSSIFNWFSADFEREGRSVVDFVVPYLPPAGRKFVEEHRKELAVKYLDYDWRLNGR